MLFVVRRGLLHVDHSSRLYERVVRELLSRVKGTAFVSVELASEVVAVNDSEDSAIDIKVHAQVEVLPSVVLSCVFIERDLVSLQENALGDTTIFDFLFNDMDCVVVQIIINNAFSDSEVLVGILNYGLLEVSGELEDLFME